MALAPSIERLTFAGIPVLGHIGLLPQHFIAGGYRKFGRSEEEKNMLPGMRSHCRRPDVFR